MKKTLFSLLLLCGVPATAMAGGSAGSIGVGAEVSSTGAADLSVNYDAGAFHVGGAIGYSDDRLDGPQSNLRVGGRFYYHLHATALADFGLGAELYIDTQDAGEDNFTEVEILGGFQIRSFISTNVALSFTGGLVIGTSDGDGLALGGTPLGVAGVHYYFF
jgi:hypothetical protein